MTVYDGLSLYLWHANRFLFPNERLAEPLRARIGYVRFHDGDWHLVNAGPEPMTEADTGRAIGPGERTTLTDGRQILLSRQDGGRLIHVQIANPAA